MPRKKVSKQPTVIPAETQIIWNQQIGPRGYQCRTTLRQDTGQGIPAYLDSVVQFIQALDALGDRPAAGSKSEPGPAAPRHSPAQDLATAFKGPDGSDSGYPSFLVTNTEIRIEKGKTLLKVRGGDWTAFGVNVWPEVLIEAGIVESEDEYDRLDPRNPPDLRGWVAFYSTRTTREGTIAPNKVVALRRYTQQGLI